MRGGEGMRDGGHEERGGDMRRGRAGMRRRKGEGWVKTMGEGSET